MNADTAKAGRKRSRSKPPVRETQTLTIGRNMNIYEAQSLKDELMEIAARPSDIVLDLSQVTEIDTCGIQLLLLAQRESAREGRSLRLSHCSPAVQELIELFNLAEPFGMVQVFSAPESAQT